MISCLILPFFFFFKIFFYSTEVPTHQRHELFLRKLIQCQVVFDFNDASSQLKGKEIKRQALQEMIDYIVTTKGAIVDPIYPEAIRMVKKHR